MDNIKEQKTLISVVMAVYNGEKDLRETIESVLNQTYTNFEFIIVNDCSTDSTPEILEEYATRDQRIVIISNEVNKKLPASLNVGIEAARGKYIARIDADDLMLPNRFERQLSALEENPEYSFIGSLVKCFYDKTNNNKSYAKTKDMEEIHFNFISESGELKDTAALIEKETYKTTRLCHSSLFGKTSVFKKLRYNEKVFAEDWDLYNRAINRGYKITKLPEVLVEYRIINTGMCGTFNDQDKKVARQKIKMLNDGILLDCFKCNRYKTAFKFLWFHYIRFKLAVTKAKALFMIKHTVLKTLSTVYKSLSVKQLKVVRKILLKLNQYAVIRNTPLLGRVIGICLHVLNNNVEVTGESVDNSQPYVNISIWTIEKKWAMGGLNTILKMIPAILNNGNKVRVINYGLHNDELCSEFKTLLVELVGINASQLDDIEIIPSSVYKYKYDLFNKDDTFIAGFWNPAEDFKRIKEESDFFNNKKFVYIIQDFEPSMLYRWGSEYVRSLATFEGADYYPIYNNSEFVCGYMKSLGLIPEWSSYQMLKGEPCVTHPQAKEEMQEGSSRISLLFYSRPTVDKNIYDIKIEAIKKFIDYLYENAPEKLNDIKITGVGEECDDVYHKGVRIENIGKLDYKDYPEFVSNYNMGLSCIISPAFAYPCIEFPKAGLVTVVNKFETRDLQEYSENILSCENTSSSICDKLIQASSMIVDVDTRISASTFELPGVDIETATQQMMKEFKL